MPLLRHVVSIASLVLISACGADSTSPQTSELGTYQLLRVNGVALPAPFSLDSGSGSVNATGGMLVLAEANRWTVELTFTDVAGSATTPGSQTLSGTYTRTRDTVYFREAVGGTVTPAMLAGNLIQARRDGVSFEFQRP